MKHNINLTYVLLALFLWSCSSSTNPIEETPSGNADKLVITDAQGKAIALNTGKVTQMVIPVTVAASGILDTPPQNVADISVPIGGIIKKTDMLQGMRVKKGDVLVELQHPDYIQLQQDYLNAASQLEYLKAEYERQQILAAENVNAQKKLQESKSQWESMRATEQGLRAKLAMLEIKPETLKQEGIQPTIKVHSPINAYVAEVNINIGKFVTPSDVMIRLVNTEHVHAELHVFEKDISRLRVGQSFVFQLSNENTNRKAKIYLIGKSISEQRTIRVHGHLETEDVNLVPGMYIKAQIETEQDTVYAVPNEAIVHQAGQRYVFIPGDGSNTFSLTPVTIKKEYETYTALTLTEKIKPETTVVTNGAHTLLSIMFNTEE